MLIMKIKLNLTEYKQTNDRKGKGIVGLLRKKKRETEREINVL